MVSPTRAGVIKIASFTVVVGVPNSVEIGNLMFVPPEVACTTYNKSLGTKMFGIINTTVTGFPKQQY